MEVSANRFCDVLLVVDPPDDGLVLERTVEATAQGEQPADQSCSQSEL